jgi:hypothetical protein
MTIKEQWNKAYSLIRDTPSWALSPFDFYRFCESLGISRTIAENAWKTSLKRHSADYPHGNRYNPFFHGNSWQDWQRHRNEKYSHNPEKEAKRDRQIDLRFKHSDWYNKRIKRYTLYLYDHLPMERWLDLYHEIQQLQFKAK